MALLFISLHPALSPVAVLTRDRVACVWQAVRDHLYHLCVHALEFCFLVERAVIGLLRLAIRLLRREEISAQVRRVGVGRCTGFCACTPQPVRDLSLLLVILAWHHLGAVNTDFLIVFVAGTFPTYLLALGFGALLQTSRQFELQRRGELRLKGKSQSIWLRPQSNEDEEGREKSPKKTHSKGKSHPQKASEHATCDGEGG